MLESSPFSVALTGSLGLKDAVRLHAELLAALEASQSVVIDATGLREADISIVQLVIAAQKTASAAGKTLTLNAGKDGVLAQLLTKSGILSADGRALVSEMEIWANAQGKAA